MPLVILDRDGVINHDSAAFIKSPAEWRAIPGSLAAIGRLNQAGYQVAVATNQSGLARGYFDSAMLTLIHEKMHAELAEAGGVIETVVVCPHGPDDDCDCRKPRPGLFFQIAEKLRCSLKDVPAIGDSVRDAEAALAAGAKPILVRSGKPLTVSSQTDWLNDVPVFDDLAAAVDALLAVKN